MELSFDISFNKSRFKELGDEKLTDFLNFLKQKSVNIKSVRVKAQLNLRNLNPKGESSIRQIASSW